MLALAAANMGYRCHIYAPDAELPAADVAARVTRVKGATFKMTALPPVRFEKTGDHKADVLAAMTQINDQVEQWVRDTPEQWLWLHNRWPNGRE